MPDPQMQQDTAPNAPFGDSAATGATGNPGYDAAARQQIGIVVMALERILPLAGSGSDVGKEVLKAISALSKFVPPGSVTPAAQMNQIQNTAIQAQQNGATAAQLRQGQQPQQQAAA